MTKRAGMVVVSAGMSFLFIINNHKCELGRCGFGVLLVLSTR
jgi:hypothetical protein